jgi:outer membrane protein OmpA-like peptidoglycan-associated protein
MPSDPIQQDGVWWVQQDDGTWIRWDQTSGQWVDTKGAAVGLAGVAGTKYATPPAAPAPPGQQKPRSNTPLYAILGVVALAIVAIALYALTSGGSSGGKQATTGAPTSAPAAAKATTTPASTAARSTASTAPRATTSGGSTATAAPAPAGSKPGLFDFDQNGENEPTCGTADFKAGLVVRTYCEDLSGYAIEPEQGATLVPGALFSLPAPPDDPRDEPITSGASVSGQHLQGADGREVVVYTLSSDTVFASGSSNLLEPARASLTAIANGLKQSYPGASFQVRGHTDSTGTAAANQTLSERRSATVADFFVSAGLDKAKVTSVGLGQTVPNYDESNQAGKDQNRRVEIVVRL